MRLFKRCPHLRTRGIYGDEIWSTMRRALLPQKWGGGEIARVRCVDCGKALYDRELDSATHELKYTRDGCFVYPPTLERK